MDLELENLQINSIIDALDSGNEVIVESVIKQIIEFWKQQGEDAIYKRMFEIPKKYGLDAETLETIKDYSYDEICEIIFIPEQYDVNLFLPLFYYEIKLFQILEAVTQNNFHIA